MEVHSIPDAPAVIPLDHGQTKGIESIKGVTGETQEERYRNAIITLNVVKKDRNMLPPDFSDTYADEKKQRVESSREQFLRKVREGEKGDAAEQARKEKLARDVEKMFPWDRGESRPVPYAQIQEALEDLEVIKPMSRQAFHKMIRRLLALSVRSDPPFNPRAVRPRPEKTPPEWDRAAALVEEWMRLA